MPTKTNTPESLPALSTVAALAADAPLRERLGAAGHRLYLSTYNYRQFRKLLSGVYRQLLGPAADVCRNPDAL